MGVGRLGPFLARAHSPPRRPWRYHPSIRETEKSKPPRRQPKRPACPRRHYGQTSGATSFWMGAVLYAMDAEQRRGPAPPPVQPPPPAVLPQTASSHGHRSRGARSPAMRSTAPGALRLRSVFIFSYFHFSNPLLFHRMERRTPADRKPASKRYKRVQISARVKHPQAGTSARG